jgi:hypothetical protein
LAIRLNASSGSAGIVSVAKDRR